jgi:ketosteroid isomerase-like protein
MATAPHGSILTEAYPTEQLEVERRLEDIMSAARRRAVDQLESYHAFGPKFTKFDDFEPLERQDAETTRQLEREAILSVEEFDPRVLDLKVDVFGPIAVTTFVMDYRVVADEGERHSFRARATMVLAKEGDGWLIVHEHFSPFVENSSPRGRRSG